MQACPAAAGSIQASDGVAAMVARVGIVRILVLIADRVVARRDGSTSMSLIQLIYTSASARGLDEVERARIVCRARVDNARLGISSVLVHVDGSFFQVLEGEVDVVDELFLRIAGDPRHVRVTEILREPITRRRFAGWCLGYADGFSGQRLPGPTVALRQRRQDALQDAGRRGRTTRHDCVYR